MSSAREGADGLSAAPPPDAKFDHRVYMAVTAGKSADEIDRLIERIAQGDDEKRDAAVNPSFETPLQAADRLERGDVVCRLLLAGADPGQLYSGEEVTALAVCCMWGEVDSVRELLKSGADANEQLTFFWRGPDSGPVDGLTAAHLCADWTQGATGAAQLECLRVLVEEGNADINARDENGDTPLAWMVCWQDHPDPETPVNEYVSLGADLEARNHVNRTPIFFAAEQGGATMLSALLAAGASPDVVDNNGWTPLMVAATYNKSDTRRGVIEELVRKSSPETLRAVNSYGDSAADWMVPQEPEDEDAVTPNLLQPWELSVIVSLRRAGTPISARNARRVMPSAATHAQRQVAELAARRSPSRRWRAHDDIVQLAFDFQELRETEEGVRRREARLVDLERRAVERLEELEEELAQARGEGGEGKEDEEMGVGATQQEKESEEGGSEGGGIGGGGAAAGQG